MSEDEGPVRGVPRVPPGGSVESTIRRDRDGRWFHDGAPVDHPGVIRSFDQWIARHEDGRYVLKNTVNWAYVHIEGAPVFVRRARVEDATVCMDLSDGRQERLHPETLRLDEAGVLYCQVRFGRLTAQFSRQATFDLEAVVDDDDDGVLLRIGGREYRPETTATPVY